MKFPITDASGIYASSQKFKNIENYAKTCFNFIIQTWSIFSSRTRPN